VTEKEGFVTFPSFSGIKTPFSGLRSPSPAQKEPELIIEATKFVTYETILVWSGVKPGGNDPMETYTRVAGCDPTERFSVKAA